MKMDSLSMNVWCFLLSFQEQSWLVVQKWDASSVCKSCLSHLCHPCWHLCFCVNTQSIFVLWIVYILCLNCSTPLYHYPCLYSVAHYSDQGEWNSILHSPCSDIVTWAFLPSVHSWPNLGSRQLPKLSPFLFCSPGIKFLNFLSGYLLLWASTCCLHHDNDDRQSDRLPPTTDSTCSNLHSLL